MTHEQINALKLDLTLMIQMIDRLVESPSYSFDEDETLSDYDRIIMSNKPLLSEIETEFEVYKQELRAQEDARLAELARIEDIKSRFDAISDIRLVIHKAGLDIPNPALELKRIIKENDQARLSLLESVDLSQDMRKTKVDELRQKRDKLLTEADHIINKLEDDSQDASAYRAYRKDLRDITEQFKDAQGLYTAAVDTLDVDNFTFPNKPV